MTDAARSFNIRLVTAEVIRAEDFQKAFTVLRNARPDGLLVMAANYVDKILKDAKPFAFPVELSLRRAESGRQALAVTIGRERGPLSDRGPAPCRPPGIWRF